MLLEVGGLDGRGREGGRERKLTQHPQDIDPLAGRQHDQYGGQSNDGNDQDHGQDSQRFGDDGVNNHTHSKY